MVIDGLRQYTAEVHQRSADAIAKSMDAAGEYVDWFTDDAAAEAGYRSLMEHQGYNVVSVVIGFPCVVTIE
jgi:hypothetical protein